MLDKNNKQKENTEASKLKELLKQHFPQTIKDDNISLKELANILELNEEDKNKQGYELTFTGKALANALYSKDTNKELKFNEQKSHNFTNTNNAIIIGDNLDALKILKAAYNEKIKMIYIDPPYNTKNENFIYPDNFRNGYKELLKEVGLIEIDNEGKEIESKNLQFFKNITASKSHSGWLAFMLPRLKLARDLLREDGVIFISIDDNEQANLKLLCDEIFGEENYIETFLWNKTQTPPSASNKTRKTHEFVLCYQKIKNDQKMVNRFSEGGDAPLWNETNSERTLEFPANYVYTNLIDGVYKKGIRDKIELLNDVEVKGGKIIDNFRLKGHFRWKQETLDNEILNKVHLIVKSNKFSIRYCRQEERIVMPTNEISKKDGVGTNETASKELEVLMNAKAFSFNKPVSLIKYLVKISTTNTQNTGGGGVDMPCDIVLDFFAGSGTTAQAVMELNAEDKANRQFILVQLDESIDPKKSKTAYDFCQNELQSKNPNISDITIERVKRASQKLEDKNLDLGFRVFNLADKTQIISDQESLKLNINENLTAFDKALNLAMQNAKGFDKKIKNTLENKIFACENDLYITSIDKEVFEYLKQSEDERVYINGYDEFNLEDILNLQSLLGERFKVVY